jgi:signal transduction histidine kinase
MNIVKRNIDWILESWRELLLAAAVTGSALYDIWVVPPLFDDGITGPQVANTVLFVLVGFALILRRRFPVAMLLAVVALMELQRLLSDPSAQPPFQTFIALLAAFYSVGVYAAPRPAAIGGAVAGALIIVADLPYLLAGDPHLDTIPSWLFMGTAWLAGWAFHRRRAEAAHLKERAARLEREREERARAAVAAERARIARELHNVVAHTVSVMVIQAQAAQRQLEGDKHDAQQALESIEDSGRQALVELRRLLGVLRHTDEQPALVPQPGLRQLDALIDQFRAAGLSVELRVEGEVQDLPPGVDLSAYRIVQEALTNVLKHAGPVHVGLAVRYLNDDIELEIIDDGVGCAWKVGSGHGLIGMRERVSVYGGVFESGGRAGGGYFVRARLPFTIRAGVSVGENGTWA